MMLQKVFAPLRIFQRFSSVGSSEVFEFSENLNLSKNPDLSNKRLLKVAILGAPNAGKSTLINKIVGHPVMCVSKKVHTTRKRERAVAIRDDTQIVFVDTPGLVSHGKIKRHNLENSFRVDGLRAVNEANVVGVIHDVSNIWTRGRLDNNILHILNNMTNKTSFLVLNKIDAIKGKNSLLHFARQLTTNDELKLEANEDPCSNEKNVKKKRQCGWSKFSEVFMVSAINGDGVSDVLDYLVKEAEEGDWFLPAGQVTDRPWSEVLKELVRGRLLDALPEEVPYKLIIETEYYHRNDLDEVIAVILVTCPLMRHQKMLVAGNGRIIREVATLAEADARHALKTNVRLRVVVTSSETKSRKDSNYNNKYN